MSVSLRHYWPFLLAILIALAVAYGIDMVFTQGYFTEAVIVFIRLARLIVTHIIIVLVKLILTLLVKLLSLGDNARKALYDML